MTAANNNLPAVCRVIRWFERDGDELVGSAPLHGVNLSDLQHIFGVEQGDPMYDCFLVTAVEASQLQPFVDVPLQLDRYEYFVEADATPA